MDRWMIDRRKDVMCVVCGRRKVIGKKGKDRTRKEHSRVN